MKCGMTTTKKAWNNPLAPLAKCEMTAVCLVVEPWGKNARVPACRIHRKKWVDGRGWSEEPLPAAPAAGGTRNDR